MFLFIQVLGHVCYHILAAGLNGYMATLTNLKNPVNKWRCGAAPIAVGFCSFHALFIQFNQINRIVITVRFLFLIDIIYVLTMPTNYLIASDETQSMMTVKRWAQNPGASSIGKPAIHPATVDLKGKAYE